MANKGRRMVFEEDIKKIGEGGSGQVTADDLEAGYGVVIEQDVELEKPKISLDTTEIPNKADLQEYEKKGEEFIEDVYMAFYNGNVKKPLFVGEAVRQDPETHEDELVGIVLGIDNQVVAANMNYIMSSVTPGTNTGDMNWYVAPEAVDTENKTIDISNFINAMPLLQVNSCTDFNDLPNPKMYSNLDYINNHFAGSVFLRGYALLKDTANNKYIIICSAGCANQLSESKLVPEGTSASPYNIYENFMDMRRSGNGAYAMKDTRVRRYHRLYMDDAWAADGYNYKINGTVVSPDNVLMVGLTGNVGSTVYVDNNGPHYEFNTITHGYQPMDGNQPNYNSQLSAPSVDGTYVLKVTVVNGAPTFSWELEQQ